MQSHSKNLREINSLVNSLVKLLLSRIFVKKVWERISTISQLWSVNFLFFLIVNYKFYRSFTLANFQEMNFFRIYRVKSLKLAFIKLIFNFSFMNEIANWRLACCTLSQVHWTLKFGILPDILCFLPSQKCIVSLHSKAKVLLSDVSDI